MRYSTNIDFAVDVNSISDIYLKEFGYKLSCPSLYNLDERITVLPSGFLISAKDVDWPIQPLVSFLDLNVETSRLFVTKPNEKLPMHRDCISGSSLLREWAINIPVDSCHKGTNEWFSDEDNDFGDEYYLEKGSAMIPEQNRQYNVTESCPLDCVKVIRTDVMHCSNNIGNDRNRVVLSLRTSNNISYQQIKDRINGKEDLNLLQK